MPGSQQTLASNYSCQLRPISRHFTSEWQLALAVYLPEDAWLVLPLTNRSDQAKQ